MNLRHFELVLKIAEFKSFTKAAEALKIPQPSLSQSILALEKELGVQIFNRAKNPISLTHAGEIYLSKARQIFNILDDLNNEISDINHIKDSKITIAFSQNGYNMLPNLIPKFCKKFSHADIKIVQIFSTLKIKEMLLNDEIDIGLLILPIDTNELNYQIIKSEEVFLALPTTHNLSQKLKNKINPKISIQDVRDEKFILPKGSQRSRAAIDEIFKKAHIKPNIFCETETFEIANSIVASGIGACFTLRNFIKDDKKDEIMLFDINEPSLAKTLVVAYKKDKKLSKLSMEFIKMAKQF